MSDTAGKAETTLSSRWIEGLDRQATIIMAIFARAGFEPIAPPVIQPADVFLDLIGEDLRSRSYVFADPSGAELCLRPDLTIPACRLYLERYGNTSAAARFAYNGPVFRYQPAGGSLTRPREFRQAGIESFGAADPAKAEAEVLALTVESVRAAGLRAFRLQFGDLGILDALLRAIDMPERWRARLRHHFWRPAAFRRQLHAMQQSSDQKNDVIPTAELRDKAAALVAVGRHLDRSGLIVQGTRTIEDIAEHLSDRASDRRSEPLTRETINLLEAYLALDAPALDAAPRIGELARKFGIDLDEALVRYEDRLKLAADEGIDVAQAQFSASFGRAFEYYTGFVFEIRTPALDEATPVGGGGRYDTLVQAISGGAPVVAVGAAIHMERLLLAVRGGRP